METVCCCPSEPDTAWLDIKLCKSVLCCAVKPPGMRLSKEAIGIAAPLEGNDVGAGSAGICAGTEARDEGPAAILPFCSTKTPSNMFPVRFSGRCTSSSSSMNSGVGSSGRKGTR